MVFRKSHSLAMVLDVSNTIVDNQRVSDCVKRQLINFITSFDEEDNFYLYSPLDIDILKNRGDRVSVLGNYESDGYPSNDLNSAFKQTYYNLLTQDDDTNRVLCYITDYARPSYTQVKRLFQLKRSMHWCEPVNYLMLYLGQSPEFTQLCQEHDADCFNIEPNQVYQTIHEYFEGFNGKNS